MIVEIIASPSSTYIYRIIINKTFATKLTAQDTVPLLAGVTLFRPKHSCVVALLGLLWCLLVRDIDELKLMIEEPPFDLLSIGLCGSSSLRASVRTADSRLGVAERNF